MAINIKQWYKYFETGLFSSTTDCVKEKSLNPISFKTLQLDKYIYINILVYIMSRTSQ